MGSLSNDDMLIEILTKLPLKSFSRSKCVSKSWHSLLSQDYLRKELPPVICGVIQPSDSSLKNRPVYISNLEDSHFKATPLDFFPFHPHSTLIDCSNGLLLFHASPTNSFHVCSPTTRRYVSLPKPSKESTLSVLAFDPRHSRHYRVVNFTGWLDRGAEFEVFDSELGRWSEGGARWGVDTRALSSTMRYLDGVLYILAPPGRAVGIDMRGGGMRCGVFGLPEDAGGGCCLGDVGGRLAYCVRDGGRVRVWARELGEWVLKHDAGVGEGRVVGLDSERSGVVYLSGGEGLVAYDLCLGRVEARWEVAEEVKGCLIQVWAFSFTKYMEDCLR